MKKIFIIIISFLFQTISLIPAFATTIYTNVGANIVVSSVSSNNTNLYPSATLTITGENLPILSPSSGSYFSYGGHTGYVFSNFLFVGYGNSGNINFEAGSPGDMPITVSSSSSTLLVITIPSPTSEVSTSLYLAPNGTNINGTPSSTYLVGNLNLASNSYSPAVNYAPVVTISSSTLNSISLTWNAVNGANSYNVYENGSTMPLQTGLAGTSTTISGLSSNANYSFQVAGVNSLGTGPLSIAVPGTTAALLPPLATATTDSAGNINLSWSSTIGANSYDIFVNGKLSISNLTQANLTLSNLPLNRSASIQVYAVDAYGNLSLPSTTLTVTPAIPGPQLTYSNLTKTSVTLNWTAVPGATSYQVWENDPILATTTTGTTATINALQPGTAYSFTVNGVTSNGNTLSSAPVAFNAPTFSLDFGGVDVLNNTLALMAGLSSLLLLALAVEFSPQMVSLLQHTASNSQNPPTTEYDENYDCPSTKIDDVNYEEE